MKGVSEVMIQEINETIKNRRSIRNWLSKSIPYKSMERVLEAARWAPSSCNRQSARFLIVNKDEEKQLLVRVSSGGKGFADLAPSIIVVLSDLSVYNLPYERNLAYVDGALAAQNLMLQAHIEGLGTCYLNWALPNPFDDKVLYEYFKIPDNMVIIGLIPIGYPDYKINIEISERKPLGELILEQSLNEEQNCGNG